VLAFIRILLLLCFIVVASSIGLLICLVRPFHRDNVGLFSRWYGKASWILGLKVEIRYHPDVKAAMPCVFVANHQNNYDLFTISGSLITGKEPEIYPVFWSVILVERQYSDRPQQ
jgi:1-acyl-sn-glycerol-3-phosphate acyltransferase